MISFIRTESRFVSEDNDDELYTAPSRGQQVSPMPVGSHRNASRARHRAKARRPRPRIGQTALS